MLALLGQSDGNVFSLFKVMLSFHKECLIHEIVANILLTEAQNAID